MPEHLAETLADLRRSEDVVRLRLGGLSDEEVAEFVRRAAGGQRGAGLRRARRGDRRSHRGQRLPRLPSSGATLAETGALRCRRAVACSTCGRSAELGTPESVREVVSQRLARLAPADHRAARARRRRRARVRAGVAPSERPRSPRRTSLPRSSEAVRSGMIEELLGSRLAFRFTHELVRTAPSTDRSARRAAGRAPSPRRRGTRGRDVGCLADARSPTSPITSRPPLRLGDGARAIDYNLRAARAAQCCAGVRRRRGAAARLHSSWGSTTRPSAPSVLLELGAASHRAGVATTRWTRYAAAAEIGAGRRQTPSMLAHAAIGFEEACWRPGIADRRRGRAARGGAGAPSATPTRRPSRSRAPGPRPGRWRIAGTSDRGHARPRRTPSPWRGEIDDRHGLATVLMRSYWAHGAPRWRRSSRC